MVGEGGVSNQTAGRQADFIQGKVCREYTWGSCNGQYSTRVRSRRSTIGFSIEIVYCICVSDVLQRSSLFFVL